MINISDLKEHITLPKVIITIIIALFFIVVILELLGNIFKKNEEIKIEKTNPNIVFYSKDNTASLDVSKKYEFIKPYALSPASKSSTALSYARSTNVSIPRQCEYISHASS